MGKLYEYSSIVLMTDTQITLRSIINGSQEIDVVTRGGSEATDFATACERHRQVALASSPTATSAPCTVFTGSRWIRSTPASTITTSATDILVPTANSGNLIVRLDSNDAATFEYSLAGGAWTSVADGDTISGVTDGQSLAFKATGLPEGSDVTGKVEDSDTGVLVDRIYLFNATPVP